MNVSIQVLIVSPSRWMFVIIGMAILARALFTVFFLAAEIDTGNVAILDIVVNAVI